VLCKALFTDGQGFKTVAGGDRGLTREGRRCQIRLFRKNALSATRKRELFLETLLGRPLEVEVRDSVDKALKILKQKMSKEGILQEIKRRRYYEKPSVKRKRKMREARKRRRREAKRRVVR
jgi:small subunit ribosomal protein S21